MYVNKIFGHVLLFTLVLFLAGCGGKTEGDPAAGGAVSGSTEQVRRLVWRFPAEMPHLNPIIDSDYYAMKLEAFLFDTLLDRNPQTLEHIPYLAERWEVSEDKLVYTFYLSKSAVFSDGQPLSAKDVKFTFDRIKDPSVDAAALRNYYDSVASCEIIDEYTVRFTCNKQYYQHLVALGSFPILPAHVYSGGNFNNHPANRNPAGSGRYVFDRWDTGAQVILKQNPKHWNKSEHPLFDEIIVKFIIDDNSAFQVLARGEVDVATVLPEQWVKQTNTPQFTATFNKYEYYRTSYSYIGWNMRRLQFTDKRVRQALTMMLDRETIIETIYQGLGMVATGPLLPGTDAHDAAIQPWPFDPKAAAALLDEAGWVDTNGNGVRDKDGNELQFSILMTQSPVAEQILTVFKEELARNGVDMTIRQMEWASMVERVDAREFDAMTMGWYMPPDPDPYQVWHSTQAEKGSNYVGFNNPEADKLIEEARVTFDDDARNAMYRRFHQIVHEEQPYTFLVVSKALLAVHKRVQNVNIYPIGVDEREWYIP